MLTTVAVLIIVLGLMVSLARYVRDRSAQQLTRQTLRDLETLMAQYAEHNNGHLPVVDPILPPDVAPSTQPGATTAPDQPTPDEATLAEAARRNNREYVAALKLDFLRHQPQSAAHNVRHPGKSSPKQLPPLVTDRDGTLDPFEQLQMPISVYDHRTLRDAWGSPIVLMPGQHHLIGLAPSYEGQDQHFFFSAGPDRKYLTREDNLYSYETQPAQR